MVSVFVFVFANKHPTQEREKVNSSQTALENDCRLLLISEWLSVTWKIDRYLGNSFFYKSTDQKYLQDDCHIQENINRSEIIVIT